MNDTILTAERREQISKAINDIMVARIMCDTMHDEATALGKRARRCADFAEAGRLYDQAKERHERWADWWDNGYAGAEVLRGMGIEVASYAEKARR